MRVRPDPHMVAIAARRREASAIRSRNQRHVSGELGYCAWLRVSWCLLE
jgi:hypothetical protein